MPESQTAFFRALVRQLSRDDAKGLAETVIGSAQKSVETNDGAIRRSGLLIVGGAILFELLDRAEVSELSIVGVRIQGTGFLMVITPVVIAAFYYQLLYSVSVSMWSTFIYRYAMLARYPEAMSLAGMDILVMALGGSLVFFTASLSSLLGRQGRWQHRLTSGVWYAFLLAPLPYLAIVYVRLFLGRGPGDVAVFASLAVAASLAALGWLALRNVFGLIAQVQHAPATAMPRVDTD